MKTVTYGSESKGKGMVNISMKGNSSISEIGEQCVAMVIKDFNWSQQMANAMKALLNSKSSCYN